VGSNVWFPLVPFGSEIPMLRCSDGSLGMRMLFCDFHFYFAVIRTSFAAFFFLENYELLSFAFVSLSCISQIVFGR
jgi:hypothetical protein